MMPVNSWKSETSHRLIKSKTKPLSLKKKGSRETLTLRFKRFRELSSNSAQATTTLFKLRATNSKSLKRTWRCKLTSKIKRQAISSTLSQLSLMNSQPSAMSSKAPSVMSFRFQADHRVPLRDQSLVPVGGVINNSSSNSSNNMTMVKAISDFYSITF